jgi:hypothetical protein
MAQFKIRFRLEESAACPITENDLVSVGAMRVTDDLEAVDQKHDWLQ